MLDHMTTLLTCLGRCPLCDFVSVNLDLVSVIGFSYKSVSFSILLALILASFWIGPPSVLAQQNFGFADDHPNNDGAVSIRQEENQPIHTEKITHSSGWRR
jgi:hypothetical protein